jgi:hypothetical protein
MCGMHISKVLFLRLFSFADIGGTPLWHQESDSAREKYEGFGGSTRSCAWQSRGNFICLKHSVSLFYQFMVNID